MGTHPQGAITCGNTGSKDGQDELYVSACQRAQVHIHVVKAALICFPERAPESPDSLVANLVIEAERHITIGRAAFTVDGGPEAIAALYPEHREGAPDISVLDVLRECEQSKAGIRRARFKFWVAYFEHEASRVTICSWTGKCSRTASPGSFTGPCRKVIGHTRARGRSRSGRRR